jgi:hypothetical protein
MISNYKFITLVLFIYSRATEATIEWESIRDPLHLKHEIDWNLTKWNLRHMLQALNGNLTNVYISPSPYFSYYNTYAHTSKYFSNLYKCHYHMENMTSTDFIAPNPNVFRYYSGNIMNPSFDNLRQFVDPLSLIGDRAVTATVWMSDKDVQATAHFDDAHNVYVQLSGT